MVPTAPLGNTGLTVSRLGLGLAAVGRPGYINLGRPDDLGAERAVPAMEARTHALLDAAVAAGIRYVDAARSYGKAEAFLSSWLARREPGAPPITIGSKWGYTYVADWQVDVEVHEVKDHSLPVLQRQAAESRALLGGELDLYQIHSATLESGVLSDASVLHELARLAAEGLVIGLSTSGPRQAETVLRALDIDVDGIPLFRTVQSTWNVLEPSVGSALADAHDAGRGVIIKEVVANGRLTPRGLTAPGPTPVDQLAMAAAFAEPFVDVVLSGAATVEQLQSHVAAVDVELTADEADWLWSLTEEPESYWQTRAALAWS